jgi:hypothetical protein
VLDLASNRLEAWTASEAGALDLAKIREPALDDISELRPRRPAAARDPVFIYEPTSPGAHPVLILLRGERAWQFRPGFDPWIQYLVNELGFAVVAPNVRGAAGYGKSFAALNAGRLRGDAVKDIGALLVYLRAQSAFDAERVSSSQANPTAAFSRSALVNFGERLRGGVDMAGGTDFVAMLGGAQAVPPGRAAPRIRRRARSGRARLSAALSPLTNADRISRPLLVLQGANDSWIAASQSRTSSIALRSHGTTSWYLLAGDEGRSFQKLHDREAYLRDGRGISDGAALRRPPDRPAADQMSFARSCSSPRRAASSPTDSGRRSRPSRR